MPYHATFRAFAEPGFGPSGSLTPGDTAAAVAVLERSMPELMPAVYRPAGGTVSYRWPGDQRWEQGFAAFEEGERTVSY
ncbi:MAG: hypothetical protein ACJ73S_06185 [Mycobacteriales bacterium]